MKEIKLTKGFSAQVDDEDYEYLNQFKWQVRITKYTPYAQRAIPGGKKQITISMHRTILNTPKDMVVDHRDRNGLNNQKSNIRNCTPRENRCNKIVFHKGTSIYRGVRVSRKHFRSAIKFNNRSIHIGMFDSEIEAAKAYDLKAKELQGDFAILNFG